jgi:hypothetical protein
MLIDSSPANRRPRVPYNPGSWFWIVGGSTTQVFSSKAAAYLPLTDAAYAAFTSRGGKPTKIDSEESLAVVLQAHPLCWPPAATTTATPSV